MTADTRNAHPYHMHEAILAQPEAFVRVVESNEDTADEFASRIASCKTSLPGRHRHLAPRDPRG